MKRPKIDIHKWRMEQVVQRINEYNQRRADYLASGEAQVHPERFAEWERTELVKRSEFERQMMTATP